MKIVVLNGTEVKGCTHSMKELFLKELGEGHEVREYLFPRDCPKFCTGCKRCFLENLSVCPHAAYALPVWEDIRWADLVVVTSPNYLFGPTAQIKAVLDHFGTKWMAHSPEKELFKKQAVLITNSIGASMKNVERVIFSSLRFWGIPKLYTIKQALFDTDFEHVEKKRKRKIEKSSRKVARKVLARNGRVRVGVKTRAIFFATKFVQKMIHKARVKQGFAETQDHRHWAAQGWLNGKKPWKQ